VNDYLEIKRHKNKPEQQFACELLHREPGYAVLRYSSNEPGLIADIRIAPQATTIAHYWHNRSYVVWRMFDSRAQLIGTLFHICSDVCIHDDHLSYDDLLLDIWIAPDNSPRILDEDELQECIDKGLINDAELRSIREAQQDILSRHPEIISGLTAFDCTPV
jgi:hypothetical protein